MFRYVDESMEEERDDIVIPGDRVPMVNGQAVPLREGPARSARPGKRVQPMDTSDEFEMNGDGGSNGDGMLQVRIFCWLSNDN